MGSLRRYWNAPLRGRLKSRNGTVRRRGHHQGGQPRLQTVRLVEEKKNQKRKTQNGADQKKTHDRLHYPLLEIFAPTPPETLEEIFRRGKMLQVQQFFVDFSKPIRCLVASNFSMMKSFGHLWKKTKKWRQFCSRGHSGPTLVETVKETEVLGQVFTFKVGDFGLLSSDSRIARHEANAGKSQCYCQASDEISDAVSVGQYLLATFFQGSFATRSPRVHPNFILHGFPLYSSRKLLRP
jgi:hypothetical protein